MIFKHRTEPSELVILKLLNNRMQLSKTHLQNYASLKKGFEGELLYDSKMEKLECDCLVLNDLLLKINNQTLQIDSLVIMNHVVYLLEIKNYTDDYLYKSEKLFQKDQSDITNPLIQLHRSESLLSQLFCKLNFRIPIQSFVLFINPLFTLYQAPLGLPFIFPNQINRFVERLNSHPSKLQEQHYKLGNSLLSLHITENSYHRCPPFHYKQLRKGILCTDCLSFTLTISGRECICTSCGNKELVESAILRNVKEFKLLLPHEKITTSSIYEWCEIIPSRKRILRTLKKNFKQIYISKKSYFE